MNLLREDGFLVARTGAFNNVVKIRPPLVFTPDHARMLLDGLDRALALRSNHPVQGKTS
jgi:4-aminobutyrate aminotransferase-like enzyme